MKKFSLFMLSFVLVMLFSVVTAQELYYVKVRSARVRAEPTTSAAVVATLSRNTAVTVLETVDGARVSGSRVWYRIEIDGQDAYIHSSLVTNVAPRGAGGSSSSSGGGGGTSGLQSTPVPDAPPVAPPSGASCNGATTCSQMVSCDQAYACLRAGDSGLDRDKDGVPCESICPGG